MLDTVIWWTGAAVLGGEASVPASEPAASSAGADTPPVFDPTAWLKVQSQLAWMLRGYNANVAELKRLQAELLEAWQQGRMKAAQELSAPGANAALQGRAPDTPPADPERYAAAGSISGSSAEADSARVVQGWGCRHRSALKPATIFPAHAYRAACEWARAHSCEVEPWYSDTPPDTPKPDSADLKQRVYTALGERLVRGLSLPYGDLSGVAEAIAQFDLLSHSVKGDSK